MLLDLTMNIAKSAVGLVSAGFKPLLSIADGKPKKAVNQIFNNSSDSAYEPSSAEIEAQRTQNNERVVAVMIHFFAVAHGITATALGPAAAPALTPMTISMILAIGTQCSASFNAKTALKIAGQFTGFLLGISGAEFLIGLFPGLGQIANGLTSFTVTELLGWATYIILRDNLQKDLSLSEKVDLIFAANSIRKRQKEFTDKLQNIRVKMTEAERTSYDSYMKIVENTDSTPKQRSDALVMVDKLLKPYGVKMGLCL